MKRFVVCAGDPAKNGGKIKYFLQKSLKCFYLTYKLLLAIQEATRYFFEFFWMPQIALKWQKMGAWEVALPMRTKAVSTRKGLE